MVMMTEDLLQRRDASVSTIFVMSFINARLKIRHCSRKQIVRRKNVIPKQ
jgi:hypothetical protein